MILCQFNDNRLGLINNGFVRDVTSALDALPSHRYPFPMGDILIAALPQLTERIASAAAHAQPIPVSEVALLSPVANPGKIVAAPVNYKKHLDEVIEKQISTL